MTSLVDVDNIIKQAREIEEKELDQEEKNIESRRIIAPPKRTFWQKLFGKEKNNFASLPRFSGNSEEELKKIIALRKQLGMDDLPLPTRPHMEQELISPIEERPKISSDEELSVFVEETDHEPVNVPSKDKLQDLRFKLGLDKDIASTKPLYDKLEEQANIGVDEQSKQYEKEQMELPEVPLPPSTGLDELKEQKEEELITSDYKEPLEIEDKDFSENKIDVSESLTNNMITDLPKPLNHFEVEEDKALKNDFVEKEPVKDKQSFQAEPLLSSDSDVFENNQVDLQWSNQDETIDKEFPEESAKTLEEENFIISEPKTNEPFIQSEPLSKQVQEAIAEKNSTISQEDVSEEELLSEVVDEQLERTSNMLEELEHGDVPVEDLVHHIELGVTQCNLMVKEKRFLDAKYKYNELCKVFEKTVLEDDERTKWFGVLRKTYDRIVEAERF